MVRLGTFDSSPDVVRVVVPPNTAQGVLMMPAAALPAGSSSAVPPRFTAQAHIWDAILVVAMFSVTGAFVASGEFTSKNSLAFIGMYVLFTAAVDVALRVGHANFAVGAIASSVGLIIAMNQNPRALGFAVALIGLAIVGAVCAVLVGVLRIPMWAVSAATLIAYSALTATEVGSQSRRINSESGVANGPLPLALGVVLCLGIGLAFLMSRPTNGDDVSPRSKMVTAAAVFASCVLAGLAGVMLLYRSGGSFTRGDNSLTVLTGLAAALIGGTNYSGRRGGVIGPLCAAIMLGVGNLWMLRSGVEPVWFLALLAVTLMIALTVHSALDHLSSARRSTSTSGSSI
jgi:ribose/xylose/arabinose/galactoside ABC-type transport system permease subunit